MKGWGGGGGGGGGANSTIERCRRRRIVARSGDQSARSAEIFFSPSLFSCQDGLSWTFVLCTASSRCMSTTSSRIDGAEGLRAKRGKIFSPSFFSHLYGLS